MAKRNLISPEKLSAETQGLLSVLNDGGDTAVILVAASFIDACLGSILERKLIKGKTSDKLLDPRGGILGSYSSRADMCYVLGFISKPIFQDIQMIGEVRNLLAHSHMALSFDSSEINKLTDKLSYLNSMKNGGSDEPLMRPEIYSGSRNRFVITSVLISQWLIIKGLEAGNGAGAA